jgi:molybdopterin synthase sulfur carrier subunit
MDRAQMKIKVKFFTSLREITGKKVDEIQFQRVITVEEFLSLLSEKYGKKFREYIYKRKGKVHSFLSFILNGKNINNMQGFSTKLKDRDVIAIIPPVGGG